LTGFLDSHKKLLDYVIRRFNASSAELKKPEGAGPSLEPPLSAIARSDWNPSRLEVTPVFKAPREDGSWFRAELDCS